MGFHSAFISLILLMNVEDILTLEPISVTCVNKNICAVSKTDVKLMCSYSNSSFKTVYWFSHKQSQKWTAKNEPEDLTLDVDYSGRVKQLITTRQSDLTIRDVRERDSGEYQLMFIMKNGTKYISSVTVYLTVTDPVESQVSVHSDFLIFLIVFVVQVLIIGAVWVWFFIKNVLSKNHIDE